MKAIVAILRDDRRWVLLSIVFGWLLSQGGRYVYPVLIEYIRGDFGISNTFAGLLFTLIVVSYAVMQFPSGILADRVGEGRVLLVSLAVTACGCGILTIAPTVLLFSLGCLVFGLGTGLYPTPQVSILSKLFPERVATAHGLAFAAGGAGTVLPIIAAQIAVYSNWRLGFGFTVPLFALTVVGVWWNLRNESDRATASTQDETARTDGAEQRETDPESPKIETFLTRIRLLVASMNKNSVLLPFVALSLISFVFHGFTAFFPAFLTDVKQFPTFEATLVYGLFFAGGTISQITIGSIADQRDTELILVAIPAIAAVALAGIVFSYSTALIWVLVVPVSVINAFFSLGMTYFVREIPDRIQGTGIGLIRTCAIGIGAISPAVFGYFVDLSLFVEWMFVLVVLLSGSTVLCTYLYRSPL